MAKAKKRARRAAKRRARELDRTPAGVRPPGPKRVTPPAAPSSPPAQDAERRSAFFEQVRYHAPYLGVEAHGCRFVVDTTDRHMGKHLFSKQGRPEFRVLDRAVTILEILIGDEAVADRTFVDVGANIGTSTVPALVSHRFGSAVCCEPDKENHRLLRVNLALNDLEGRARTLQVGVSNRVGLAELVVHEESGGFSWIAVDSEKIRHVEGVRERLAAEDPAVVLPAMNVVEVELVTLDHLAANGVIDPERVGMVWIDTEGHEGHVLQGAGTLTDRGVPIVFEFDPAGQDERGDRDAIHEIAERSYTHFVDIRRQQADEPRFRLRPVAELSQLADRLLGPSRPGAFTDLLLLRLDTRQADVGESLPELVAKRRGS